jgi:hypothetical protein
LEYRRYGRMKVIRLGLRGIMNVNRVYATRHIERRSIVEILAELFGVHGST